MYIVLTATIIVQENKNGIYQIADYCIFTAAYFKSCQSVSENLYPSFFLYWFSITFICAVRAESDEVIARSQKAKGVNKLSNARQCFQRKNTQLP